MVICQKFDDNYENVTTNRDEFMKKLRERCGDTCRYEMKPDEVEFFAAQSDGQKIHLHWLDGDTVKSSEEKVPDGMEKLWDSEETNNIGLVARFPDDKGGCIRHASEKIIAENEARAPKGTLDFEKLCDHVSSDDEYPDLYRFSSR